MEHGLPRVVRCGFEQIAPLWERQRAAATHQIVCDSILPRGLADAYVIQIDGASVGYAGVWNEHFPGRLMAFHVEPDHRLTAEALFVQVVEQSGATHVEAQTNEPLMAEMLRTHCAEWTEEKILFRDGDPTRLSLPGGTFRARTPSDEGPEGEWIVEIDGVVAGAGGVLGHYNPPFRDLYMETREGRRHQGIGGWLIQELRRQCRQDGGVPAARCNWDNEASRRTLVRGGMVECGRLVAGTLTIGRT